MDQVKNTLAELQNKRPNAPQPQPDVDKLEAELPLQSIRQKLRFSSLDVSRSEQTGSVASASTAHAVSDRMKIYLRVRPLTEAELAAGEEKHCFTIDGPKSIVANASADAPPAGHLRDSERLSHRFAFSRVFNESVSQSQMFDGTVADLVKQLLQGHSGLVFSYGVTSAGKTHTIQGSGDQPGILPRALKSLFDNIGDRLLSTPAQPGCLFRPDSFSQAVQLSRGDAEAAFKKTKALLQSYEAGEAVATAWCNNSRDSVIFDSRLSSDAAVDSSTTCESDSEVIGDASSVPSSQKRFCVWVSYAEIYNEVVYDLLEPIVQRGRKPSRTALDVRWDKTGKFYIKGLRCLPVCSAQDACRLVLLGKQNQSVAATVLNQQSSRSHSLFAVRLVTCLDKEAPNFGLVSSLTFCDLAGSESQRTARYGANIGANDRAREACSINSSLLTLRRCIETLQHNQQNPKSARLVPFRESKLTQLIQPYFSGSGRATMIVNISRCANSDGEDEQQYEVTYVDANEFEMADIAQCSKEEMLKLIGDLRQTVQQQEEEMEEREMRIRRELIAERDRLMSEVEERFEQQLQEQKELQEERHDTRLREYLDTSQRISDNLKKRMVEAHKRKLAELQAKIDRLEEQLGEARSEAEQQDEQLENLNNKVEKLEMELAAAQSVSTKEAIEAEVNIRVRRIGDMHRRLAESADISSLARSHPPPPTNQHRSAMRATLLKNDSFLVHELEAELVEEQENRERQVGAMTATLACSQEMLDGLRMERELLAEELKTARLTVEEQAETISQLRSRIEALGHAEQGSEPAAKSADAIDNEAYTAKNIESDQSCCQMANEHLKEAAKADVDLEERVECLVQKLREEMADSKAKDAKLEEMNEQVLRISSQAEAQLQQLNQQLLELKDQLESSQSGVDASSKSSDLVEKLRQSEAKLESISAESSAKDEQLLELRRRLDEA
uniref:Kinesin motor domain-containing protein n=1 Tax=Macrostomum lignano TaxID=282301 RepID=A0A1I8JF92_9PLAT